MAEQILGKYRRTTILIFAVVYVALAIARLKNTLPRHIIDHDEGHSLLNADTWHRIFRWVLSGGLSDGSDALATLRDSFHREGGTLYTAGKFGYSLLLALVALPGHVTASEGLILAWLCGLALPIVAGWITWQYTRAFQPALVTAGACITSALLMGLSREVSGTIWALTLTLLGLALLQHGIITCRWWRWGLPAGALIAAGFSCHFNSAPLILGSFAAAFFFAQSQSVFPALRLAPAALAACICLALLEAATQIVDYRLRVIFPEYRSMLGDLWKMLTQDQVYMMQGIQYGDGELGWGRAAWGYWWDIFRHREPVFACSAFIALGALGLCPVHERRHLLPPLILWLTPFAFYILHPAKVERVLGMVIATGWIAIAGTAWYTIRGMFKPKSLLECLPLFFIQWLLWGPVTDPVSPVPRVVHQTLCYVQQEGGTITAGAFDKTFAPVWKWTILELARKSPYAAARSHIDFSNLQPVDITFEAYRLPADEKRLAHTLAAEKATSLTIISKWQSDSPPWLLRVIRQR